MDFSKAKTTAIEVGTIITGLAALITLVSLYFSNVWTPAVTFISADYVNGVAVVNYRGDDITLYPNEKYGLGWGWSVQLGTDWNNNPQRVEIIKNDQTSSVLDVKS